MPKIFSLKLLLLLLPLAVIIFAAISLLYKPPSPAPIVLFTDPGSGSQSASIYEPVRIQLDQSINPSLLTVSSTPSEDWQVVASDQNTYSLTHPKYLQVATPYTLDLFYDGQPLYQLSFTTHAQQSDPRYVQEVVAQMQRDYPLSSVFPYDHPYFSALYTAPLTIQITLKSTAFSEDAALTQVKSLFRQKGVDPLTHTFTVIPAPSPSPTPAPQLDEFGQEIVPPAGPVDPLYY